MTRHGILKKYNFPRLIPLSRLVLPRTYNLVITSISKTNNNHRRLELERARDHICKTFLPFLCTCPLSGGPTVHRQHVPSLDTTYKNVLLMRHNLKSLVLPYRTTVCYPSHFKHAPSEQRSAESPQPCCEQGFSENIATLSCYFVQATFMLQQSWIVLTETTRPTKPYVPTTGKTWQSVLEHY